MTWPFFFPPGIVVLVVVIFFFAASLQSTIGFGSSVLASPFLVIINPLFVPGPMLVAGIVLAILIVLRHREQVEIKNVAILTAGRILGSILGAAVLLHINEKDLSFAFALLLLLSVGLSAGGLKLEFNTRTLISTGVLSGLMGAVAALGGAAASVLYQHEKGDYLRGNLAAYLLPGGIATAVILRFIGKLGATEIELFLMLLPGLLAGFFLAGYTSKYIDRYVNRWVILGVSGSAGLYVMINYLVQRA